MWRFALTLFCLVGGAALLITAALLVAATVYVLPYLTWFGWNCGSNGIPRKSVSGKLPAGKSILHTVKNATKLYRSWITRTPHNITQW